jgi:hypothetical protein
MKVTASTNTKQPKNTAYAEVGIITVIKRNGYTFALTRSHNSLMSCYMLAEYSTGRVLTAFGVPKLNMKDTDVDRAIERAHKHIDGIDSIDSLEKYPVVNDDEVNENEVDYSDVKVKERIKEQKEKEIKDKVEAVEKPVKPKTTASKDATPKKKRGRPKKKPDSNTLF